MNSGERDTPLNDATGRDSKALIGSCATAYQAVWFPFIGSESECGPSVVNKTESASEL